MYLAELVKPCNADLPGLLYAKVDTIPQLSGIVPRSQRDGLHVAHHDFHWLGSRLRSIVDDGLEPYYHHELKHPHRFYADRNGAVSFSLLDIPEVLAAHQKVLRVLRIQTTSTWKAKRALNNSASGNSILPPKSDQLSGGWKTNKSSWLEKWKGERNISRVRYVAPPSKTSRYRIPRVSEENPWNSDRTKRLSWAIFCALQYFK